MYNDLHFKVEHYHYDIFELTTDVFQGQKKKATFHTDVRGNIDQVSVSMQDGVKDIVFTRMPEKKMQNKAFLEKFVGEYDLQGMTVTVSLKGDTILMVTVTGQGSFELIPMKGTEFKAKKLEGYSIKFILDDSGKVTGLEAHQPNGVFTAEKKK